MITNVFNVESVYLVKISKASHIMFGVPMRFAIIIKSNNHKT